MVMFPGNWLWSIHHVLKYCHTIHTQACNRMKNMSLDPDAPESMKYGPMLIGIRFDGGNINKSSSACPFAVTVGNTNYGGLDAAATIMYMPKLEVVGHNRETENFRLAIHHLYQEIVVSVVSVVERVQRNGIVCSLPTGHSNGEETWTLLPVIAAAQFDTKERYFKLTWYLSLYGLPGMYRLPGSVYLV